MYNLTYRVESRPLIQISIPVSDMSMSSRESVRPMLRPQGQRGADGRIVTQSTVLELLLCIRASKVATACRLCMRFSYPSSWEERHGFVIPVPRSDFFGVRSCLCELRGSDLEPVILHTVLSSRVSWCWEKTATQ